MRKAFAIEFEVPDNITPAEEQLLHDALSRVDRYVANAQVVNILPFEAWTGTNRDPNQNDPIPSPGDVELPFPVEPSNPQALSGMPVKVTTAAIPQNPQTQAPVAAQVDEAAPTFLYPKGQQPGGSPVMSTEQTSLTSESSEPGVPELVPLTLRRDILAAMAKGAYYEDAAKWFADVLATMPIGQNEVMITADFWQ